MVKFEELPEKVRALILAKLGAELAAHKSTNLYQLARMQRTDIAQVWRDIGFQIDGYTTVCCGPPCAQLSPAGSITPSMSA
jgi:hypothetical protein